MARARSTRPPHIHKFGGASLADAAAIRHAVGIVRAQRPDALVVVVSAMGGGTDALLDGAARAARGDASQVRAAAEALRAQHAAAARALVPAGARLEELLRLIDAAFAELEQVAGGLGVLGELTPRTTDYLAARGERLSARLFAAALDAAGCRAAYVDDARVVPQVHVREAAELAYYGAKVLHPRALIPVIKRNVAIRIRPFADPTSLGTEISRRRTLHQYPVKALSAIPQQALLTVAGSGMLGVPGIAARTFAAVHHEGISVSLITQASSEHSICFSVPAESAERARKSLEETFRPEIGRQEIDGVEVRTGLATLVVVGLGMAGTPGIAARVFSALAEARINVIATGRARPS